MSKQITSRKQSEQPGVAAILFVLMLSILLITTSLVSARLSIKEVRQSSEVNISDQAFVAAEAGVEEAFNRIEKFPRKELEDLFPEQYNGLGTLVGDEAVLVDGEQNRIDEIQIVGATTASNIGTLAWRERKVYDYNVDPQGTQRKDESIEIDTSELRRVMPNGNVFGSDNGNTDSNGEPLQNSFRGIDYCWLPRNGSPIMELTVYSWPEDDFSNVDVRKAAIPSDGTLFENSFGSGTLSKRPGSGAYTYCLRYDKSTNSRRYLFRIRPIFTGVSSNHSAHTVDYQITVRDNNSGLGGKLGLANNAILVDVIGQSGDIRRRLVVKKEKSGRLLGIFDFVLYSGDPTLPLCKAGVQQGSGTYDPGCLAVPITN